MLICIGLALSQINDNVSSAPVYNANITATVTPTSTPTPTPDTNLPDLIIVSVNYHIEAECDEPPATVLDVFIRNQGSGTVNNFYVYSNGDFRFVETLDPGDVKRLSFPWRDNPPIIVVDSGNDVDEVNEYNNQFNDLILVATPTRPLCTPTISTSTPTITPTFTPTPFPVTELPCHTPTPDPYPQPTHTPGSYPHPTESPRGKRATPTPCPTITPTPIPTLTPDPYPEPCPTQQPPSWTRTPPGYPMTKSQAGQSGKITATPTLTVTPKVTPTPCVSR